MRYYQLIDHLYEISTSFISHFIIPNMRKVNRLIVNLILNIELTIMKVNFFRVNYYSMKEHIFNH